MLKKTKNKHAKSDSGSPLSFIRQGRAGDFLLNGEMTFDTASAAIRDAGGIISAAYTPLQFDLSGVSRADSAGVALMIEWQKAARRARCELQYVNLPASVQSIIHVTGVASMLPVGPANR